MRILNQTGLQVAAIAGRLGFPGHSLTVVVKAFYRLAPGLTADLIDHELAFPTGDVAIDEEDDARTDIRYESDFAHYKPKADLLLVGKCRPPGGQPVGYCPVTFRVGDHGRTLHVFGDRGWELIGARIGEPAPFTEIDLGWERAFGGPGYALNPVGQGYRTRDEEGAAARRLPNIEDPRELIASPGDRPVPASFGPIQRSWEPRASKVGTYGTHWQNNRWPWFAEDMDWSLFNAAPEPMQVEGYLRGDEEVYLENIHPEHPRFTTRLPGVRVRCFLSELPPDVTPPPRRAKARTEWSPPPRDQMVFREVALVLDTLWIDAEAETLVLVWRGAAAVRDQDFSGVEHLFIRAEPLEDAPAELAVCQSEFWRIHDEDEGKIEAEEEEAEAAESAREPVGEPEEEEEPVNEGLEQVRAELEKMGIDPDNPPEVTEEEKERAKAFFREQGMNDLVALLEATDEQVEEEEVEPPRKPWTRERVEARYAEDGDLEGADLRRLDLSGLTLDGATLQGADLSGSDLRAASLVGAVLTGARLSDADLGGVKLDDARMSECELANASLRGASLAGADLTAAGMEGVDLTEADLTGAVLERAVLRRASLIRANSGDAVFVGADFTGALLRDGGFDGSDFSEAVLDEVDARDASFGAAEFGGVRAVRAVFMGASMTGLRAADALDMSESNFSQIQAAESIWTGATLTGADFGYALLDGADFTDADLGRANLSAARLRAARFANADLTSAWLIQADIFEGNFERANLTGADLRGANLYGAELLDAQLQDALTESSNLNMTKYA
jgi:uncharacterized protein YjbI with pentapeptide repeats